MTYNNYKNINMPPKPWETRKKPVENISEIIQSNPTPKQEVPKITGEIPQNSTINNTSNATERNGMYGAGGMGSYGSSMYGGGMGSSMYGGGMGSYGSSMYGGMGSSMYGGMGGMYGMNRGGAQDPNGMLFKAMMGLQSFTFLINSLCQIAHSLNQNYDGISLFYNSFKGFLKRIQQGTTNRVQRVIAAIKNFFLRIFNFLVQNIFFMRQKGLKSKYKALKAATIIAVGIFAITCYPLLQKALSKS